MREKIIKSRKTGNGKNHKQIVLENKRRWKTLEREKKERKKEKRKKERKCPTSKVLKQFYGQRDKH